jgi:hypothetical protein
MSALAMIAVGFGSAAVLGKLAGLLFPQWAAGFLRAFPRSRGWAWALTVIDLLLVSYLVWTLPTSWFTPYRGVLLLVCPLAIYLVVTFVDELLAPRALGGLLLLAAAPVLAASRFHESQARLVMVVLAYSWVFPGMLLVASPWWFRKLTAPFVERPALLKLGSLFGMALGAVLIYLGLMVY